MTIGEGDPMEIVQVVYAQLRICPGEWTTTRPNDSKIKKIETVELWTLSSQQTT